MDRHDEDEAVDERSCSPTLTESVAVVRLQVTCTFLNSEILFALFEHQLEHPTHPTFRALVRWTAIRGTGDTASMEDSLLTLIRTPILTILTLIPHHLPHRRRRTATIRHIIRIRNINSHIVLGLRRLILKDTLNRPIKAIGVEELGTLLAIIILPATTNISNRKTIHRLQIGEKLETGERIRSATRGSTTKEEAIVGKNGRRIQGKHSKRKR